MSFLANPRLIFFLRLVQLAFAIAFLIVLAWCNTHKTPWIHIEGPVAMGIITTIFNLLVSAHGAFINFNTDFIKIHGIAYVVGRMIVDFVLALMWICVATLMLRPKDIDYTILFPPAPPDVPWAIGVAFAIVEIVAFLLTMFLIFMEHRSGSRTSPSGAYV